MQWIALGQGHQMAGANIFVVYANSKGDNVTLSPRLGKGNVEPDYNSQAQVFLLDGTGIANGMMTANVRCKLTFLLRLHCWPTNLDLLS